MKTFPILLFSVVTLAQTPQQTPVELATRMSQLMESTAVAVPGLIRASEPLRKQAETTIGDIKAAPRNGAYPLHFISQATAYLALADAYRVPGIPPVAEQQFAELRDDLTRFRERLETDLAAQAKSATAQAADPNNLHRYADSNSKLPPLGTLPRVVFLGDSITDGWHLNEYFSGRDFVNRGISGQTTIQMLGRFLQDVAGPKPKAVVVLGGINDIARGISPQAIEDTLNMIGDLAKAHGIKAIFASIMPVSTEVAKARPAAAIVQVNKWLQDYCRREGFTYLDYFTALADANGQLPADLSDDGLHPNAKGYRVITPVALEAINRALEPTPGPGAPAKKKFSLPIK
jgi:lysophospholipase L1-like esterase